MLRIRHLFININTDVEPPPGPIGNGYGTPESEFTIWQMLPTVANGIPPAVTTAWVMTEMIPESGGPAAPGLNMTAHPIETGGPGISTSVQRAASFGSYRG